MEDENKILPDWLQEKILNNAEIDDNIADAVLIGVLAVKTLRRD